MVELHQEHKAKDENEPIKDTLLKESDNNNDNNTKGKTAKKKSVMSKIDLNTLPKDLCMDNYSSDKEDTKDKLGGLLVENGVIDMKNDKDKDATELENIGEDDLEN